MGTPSDQAAVTHGDIVTSTIVRRDVRRTRSVVAAIVAALVAFALVTTAEAPASAAQPLTWAPPSGWQNYEEVVISSSGGTINLDPDRNYRISAPQVIRGPVDLRGGRNIVWIGGHVSINDMPAYSVGTDRRGLVIRDHLNEPSHQGRIVHIEGLLFDGNDLSEGIDLAAPSAIIQIQNVRVSAALLRGADDRDGTGNYPGASHPDVLQPWGGYGEIRVDGLTGYTNYQGLYLLQDIGTPTQGDIYFRRMNLEAIERRGEDGYDYAGHRLSRWDPAKTGQQFLDRGTVWMRHHRNSGWTATGVYRHAYRNGQGQLVPDPPPGNSRFEDNLYLAPTINSDQLGTYATWSQNLNDGRPAVRNWTDTGKGRVYSGRPPGGDYVPESMVGRNYQSPGYGTGGETETTILGPSADAFVKEASPRLNGGLNAQLSAKDDPDVITYLRFVVPANIGDVESAVLRLRIRSEDKTRVVIRKAANGAWGETQITYETRLLLKRKLGSAILKKKGKWVEIDVSSLVTGPGAYNIAVVGRRSEPGLFYSRESNSSPELIVTSR